VTMAAPHPSLAALRVPAFLPAPGPLANAHVQTVLVPYLPAPRAQGERVAIPIEGGSLAAYLDRATPGRDARACALLIHGIAGTADEPFVLRLSHLLNRRGIDALRIHLRGAGDSTRGGYVPLFHAGLTDDVRAALSLLASRYARVHVVGFSLGFPADLLRDARTIRDFDDAVVAPLFGFRNARDYYTRVSAQDVLHRIAVPTLILHAEDDPLVPAAPLHDVARLALPNVRVEVTAWGGHVGFLGRAPAATDETRYWAEQRAADLVVATSR